VAAESRRGQRTCAGYLDGRQGPRAARVVAAWTQCRRRWGQSSLHELIARRQQAAGGVGAYGGCGTIVHTAYTCRLDTRTPFVILPRASGIPHGVACVWFVGASRACRLPVRGQPKPPMTHPRVATVRGGVTGAASRAFWLLVQTIPWLCCCAGGDDMPPGTLHAACVHPQRGSGARGTANPNCLPPRACGSC
jgi:hypothetical protein